MKKIYSYRTNKLYESAGTYKVSVEELDSETGEFIDSYEFDSDYASYADADGAVLDFIQEIKNEECDGKDCGMVDESGDCDYSFILNDKEWRFTIIGDDDYSSDDDYDEYEEENESVSSRFARYRRLYESNDDEEHDSDDESNDDEEHDSDDESNDDEELTGIVLTVGKDDADACKDELVDAGIDEDDIEILDSDDDDEDAKIRVDVNSVMALKDYLSGKGINLEDEIGAEIVSDDEDEEDDDSKDDAEDGEDDDDMNFDDFADLFGDDEDSDDK